MTAMIIMQSGNITVERATMLLEEQMGEPIEGVTVVQGNYTPDAALAAGGRFLPNVSPFNAVQVDAHIPATKVMLGNMLPDDLQIGASARAARRTRSPWRNLSESRSAPPSRTGCSKTARSAM